MAENTSETTYLFARDTTIADIVDRLAEPDEYIRRALGNLMAAVKNEPDAGIAIGARRAD